VSFHLDVSQCMFTCTWHDICSCEGYDICCSALVRDLLTMYDMSQHQGVVRTGNHAASSFHSIPVRPLLARSALGP